MYSLSRSFRSRSGIVSALCVGKYCDMTLSVVSGPSVSRIHVSVSLLAAMSFGRTRWRMMSPLFTRPSSPVTGTPPTWRCISITALRACRA